jgi:hypothetical protein
MLPTKFQFIWESGFRGEDFLEIDQSKTRMVCGGHVCIRRPNPLTNNGHYRQFLFVIGRFLKYLLL